MCARREREKKGEGEGEREGGRKTDSMKPVVYLHTVGSRPHQVKVYPYTVMPNNHVFVNKTLYIHNRCCS